MGLWNQHDRWIARKDGDAKVAGKLIASAARTS